MKMFARLAMISCIAVLSLSSQVRADDESPSAVDVLNAWANAMAGNGDQFSGFGDYMSGQGDYLAGYAEVIRAQGEYIRMVAEARLTIAQAQLVEAQTAAQWQEVRRLTILVDRLEREMRQLARAEHQQNRKIEDINRLSRTINVMVTGRVSQYTYRAFDRMLMKYVPTATVTAVMTVQLPEISADHFESIEGESYGDFPGGNVGKMWHYMKTNKLKFSPWSDAHIVMMLALESINEASEQQIQKYREYIAAIREGVFDVWNPPSGDTEGEI